MNEKRDKYFELASFTEINLASTFATISLNWVVGSRSIKHWKHSKSTAFAPFLRFDDTLEQTES